MKEGLDEDNIITFDLRRQKTNVDYITFCSPEATEAIKAYMEYRNRPIFINIPERINQFEKRRIRSDNDCLFIKLQISDEYLESFDEKYRFISDQEIQHAYRVVERSCEKKAPKGSYSYIRSHNMRKFFANTIKNHGLDFVTIETLLGHKVQGSLCHYTEANIHDLKEQYMKALPFILINEELEVKTLESYDYAYNQANIQISNVKSNAMMELYPYLYRIIEDSKEILRKYDTIIKLNGLDSEKFRNLIDDQYKKIDELNKDRDYNEGELNNKITDYQRQVDDINKRFKVHIPVSFNQFDYDYEAAEQIKIKELN